ncbi:MAG: hypothetical protein AMQ22_00709 [Candidatus Methanofastidiosum methylothiophilum]|uniref:Uncharacterized protein n=1 Tax=Candidatus Methanofastidiosum methylothiophilum TaxID=1705564 RepID=A0A150J5Z3_9EURY|nr:MAG: hypothetical protein AMQ22_00709 [Candidatus Methanofastidiosum methylthiophilus]
MSQEQESKIEMQHENEIIAKINDIATVLAEEKIRNEERNKNMLEKIDRALSHAHDARNVANAYSVRVEIAEKDIRNITDDIKALKEEKFYSTKNKVSIVLGVVQTVTSAGVIALLIFLWEHIYNK